MNKNCIMFITHIENNFVAEQFEKLKKEIDSEKYDLWLIFNGVSTNIKHDKIFFFNERVVEQHGFKMHFYDSNRKFYIQNSEYIFLPFFKSHQNYDFYWLIEYDVYANMNWNDLFSFYDEHRKNVDFYSTNIQKIHTIKLSSTWEKFKNYLFFTDNRIINHNDKVWCFNPIDRFSKKALTLLLDSYEQGNYGFYEIMMPTLFYLSGIITMKNFGKDYDNPDFLDDFSDHEEMLNNKTIRCERYEYKNLQTQQIFHPIKNK